MGTSWSLDEEEIEWRSLLGFPYMTIDILYMHLGAMYIKQLNPGTFCRPIYPIKVWNTISREIERQYIQLKGYKGTILRRRSWQSLSQENSKAYFLWPWQICCHLYRLENMMSALQQRRHSQLHYNKVHNSHLGGGGG